ncbi:MAG: hydroxyacylglutathione hydrolase [Pseudomonadota bacterium]
MPQSLEVHQFLCLSDNYGYLVHDPDSGNTAVIDTPEAAPIEAALREKGWTLTHILNTHHHGDHVGGNLELKSSTGCSVVGPLADRDRIPGIDVALGDGDEFRLGDHRAVVYDTPGHTSGHICYHFEDDEIAFVGDTLFALGCGRLFEGTPAQMWDSLSKMLAWPDETAIYCGHEYTQANARFALSVEPDNAALQARAAEIDRLRADGLPTIPTTMGLERATNPFLRPDSVDLQKTIGLDGAGLLDVFTKTRALKDSY